MPANKRFLAAATGCAVLFISGCASVKTVAESPEKICREKFDQGKKFFEKKRDPEAQEKLRDISVNCVGYDFAEEAQYMLAESHYRTEQWIEAQTEFQILVDHWERSKYLTQARWKISHAAYLQAPSWDRDPSLTQQAIEKADAYLSDFPTGEWTDSAREDRDDLIGRLADRYFETANLYLRMDEPLAATVYFKLLLKEHPDSKRVPQARIDMAKAYALLDQFDRARESLDLLRKDSAAAEPLAYRIGVAEKFIEKSQRKFDERREREAAEAKQGKL
jgi:outer membrane protein assembly factor BamD